MRNPLLVVFPLLLLVVACGNIPPSEPIVDGMVRGRPGDSMWYSALSVDADGDSISYLFDWDDGNQSGWSELCLPAEKQFAVHVFDDSGAYGVRAKARDAGQESPWSDNIEAQVRDYGPFAPRLPLNSGSDTVLVEDTVAFATAASHPLLWERVAIQFCWGDSLDEWGEFDNPGATHVGRHAFIDPGVFEVKARAKDSLEYVSDWSKPSSLWVVDSLP